MTKFFTALSTLFLILVFTPSSVNADPIVITDGFIRIEGLGSGPTYSLLGNNFAATGSGIEEGATGPAVCTPCAPGKVLSLNSTYTDSSLGHGSATVNGVFFPDVLLRGVFNITGESLVVPNSVSPVTLTGAFSFSGFIMGCQLSDVDCQAPLFTTQLVGSGLATVQLSVLLDPQRGPLFDFESVNYAFNTNIPEPASLLLLTSGVAALGVAKLRRRR